MQKVAVVALDKLLAVAEGASNTINKIRPILQMLHFKDDYVEGTDGFMIIRYKIGEEAVEQEGLMHIDTIKRARAIQRSNRVPAEVYENSVVVVGGEATSYLSKDVSEFPNTQKIMDVVPTNVQTICLDVKLMQRMLRAAEKLGVERLTYRVAIEKGGLRTLQMMVAEDQDNKFKAVIMPINL